MRADISISRGTWRKSELRLPMKFYGERRAFPARAFAKRLILRTRIFLFDKFWKVSVKLLLLLYYYYVYVFF